MDDVRDGDDKAARDVVPPFALRARAGKRGSRGRSTDEGQTTMTADDYIDDVLSRMPAATPRRHQIGTELRGHIAERMAQGRSLDEVLRDLGDPGALADSYLAGLPMGL